jgi:hypothetical protein
MLLDASWQQLTCTYDGVVAIQRGVICQLAAISYSFVILNSIYSFSRKRSSACWPRLWRMMPTFTAAVISCYVAAVSPADPSYPTEIAVITLSAAIIPALSTGSTSRSSLVGSVLVFAGVLLAESAGVRLASSCAVVPLAVLDIPLAMMWIGAGLILIVSVSPSAVLITSPTDAAYAEDVQTSERPRTLAETLTFSFLNSIIAAGALRQLRFADLLLVPAVASTAAAARRLLDRLQRAEIVRPTLGTMLFSRFWLPFVILGALQGASTAITFAGPLLLNALLQYLDSGSGTDSILTSPWAGLLWALLLPLQAGVGAIVSTQFSYRAQLLQLQVRAGVTAAVFKQMLIRSPIAKGGGDSGEIINFISVDVQKIMDAVSSMHQFWSLPLQVAVTLYLLYTQLRWAFVAGLVVLAFFTPLNVFVSRRIGSLTAVMMAHRDDRVKATSELLSGIRNVKLLSWEDLMIARVASARSLEVRALTVRKYLDAVCVFLWASTPVLISLATFVTAAALGGELSSAQVFTSLSLLNLLISPMNAFPWVGAGEEQGLTSRKPFSLLFFSPISSEGDNWFVRSASVVTSPRFFSFCSHRQPRQFS